MVNPCKPLGLGVRARQGEELIYLKGLWIEEFQSPQRMRGCFLKGQINGGSGNVQCSHSGERIKWITKARIVKTWLLTVWSESYKYAKAGTETDFAMLLVWDSSELYVSSGVFSKCSARLNDRLILQWRVLLEQWAKPEWELGCSGASLLIPEFLDDIVVMLETALSVGNKQDQEYLGIVGHQVSSISSEFSGGETSQHWTSNCPLSFKSLQRMF